MIFFIYFFFTCSVRICLKNSFVFQLDIKAKKMLPDESESVWKGNFAILTVFLTKIIDCIKPDSLFQIRAKYKSDFEGGSSRDVEESQPLLWRKLINLVSKFINFTNYKRTYGVVG